MIVFRRKRRELTEARPQIVSKSPVSNLLLFSHLTFFNTTLLKILNLGILFNMRVRLM